MPKAFRLTLPRSPWSWLALTYCILPLVIRGFPLAGEIQYEFAAIIALAASILSSAVPLLSRRLSARADAEPGLHLWELATRTLPIALIPLGVYLLLLPFGTQCAIDEGVVWYILLVLPSAAIGLVIGMSIAILVERRWLRGILWGVVWGASLARGGFEAIEGPHIYLYCWQVGFYPGGSWDAELPVPALLVVYRIWHLLVALAIAIVVIQIARLRNGRDLQPGALALAAVVAILSLVAIPERAGLGLTRTDTWLQAELGDSLRTRFTTIYYNSASADSLDIWRAASYSDFHIAEQAKELGIAEADVEPVSLYLYSSAAEQKRLVGTASASFTKPWKRMIHLAFDRVTSTLEHELVHVMIEPFGNPLGISVSQGLLEGSAVAIENDLEWRSIHTDAAALYRLKMAPPPARIMGVGGFTAQRASVAYLIAGSFSRWLIDTYGMPKYLEAFPWGNFEDPYGKSLEELSSEYMRFIERNPEADSIARNLKPTMRYLYGGGSFFYQRCLRRLGSLNAEGYRALAEERYDEALLRFRESMDEGITYSARGGVLRALHAMGRYREMLDSAAVYDRDTASYPLLPFLVERGDAYWALGDREQAKRLYDSVERLQIGLSTSTRVALRRTFLRDSNMSPVGHGPADDVEQIMRTYFTRSMPLAQRIDLIDRAIEISDDRGQQLVLFLMRATLLAPTLPLTVANDIRRGWSRHGAQLVEWATIGRGEDAAIGYLLHGLGDPMLYSDQLRHSSLDGSLPAPTIIDGPHYQGPVGSDGIRERRKIHMSFREFLRNGILP